MMSARSSTAVNPSLAGFNGITEVPKEKLRQNHGRNTYKQSKIFLEMAGLQERLNFSEPWFFICGEGDTFLSYKP